MPNGQNVLLQFFIRSLEFISLSTLCDRMSKTQVLSPAQSEFDVGRVMSSHIPSISWWMARSRITLIHLQHCANFLSVASPYGTWSVVLYDLYVCRQFSFA